MQNLLKDLTELLSKNDNLVAEGKLLKNKVIELALKMDTGLIKHLLKSKTIKKHFFTEIDGILVFDKIKFQKFVSNKEFLPDSYTAFKNKIGLVNENGEYLSETKDVVLAWPYKDCILEGGQTKEDQERDEIFWNETLAPAEIDRLLAPKVFMNFKKYDKDGEYSLKGKEEIDFAQENLIIKGNNLLAINSLEKRFAGKIKLIYIDPPFNTGNDTFNYNDCFNHSSWLTFIKNRLEIAKKLLKPDGVFFIHIDDKEAYYLKVLCDSIFGRNNFLTNEKNEYRAVFAVDKLNEGWDVLNLFDIVRLYDTRDAKQGKPGKTTISEAQLIGRGARYCPFQIEQTQPKYQRKYDEDISNELRICEELYYHSAYNPKYIQELDKALQDIGIKAKQTREIQLQLKPKFKKSDFYKDGLIFLNDRIKYDRAGIFSLPNTITEHTFQASLYTGAVQAMTIFEDTASGKIATKRKDFYLRDFGFLILRKAIARLEFYQFNNLKFFLPNLSSVHEFITSEKYLGKIKLEIEGPEDKINNLLPDEKLQLIINVFVKISESLQADKIEYQGTEEFKPSSFSKRFKDKTLNIFIKEDGDQEYGVPQSQTANTALQIDLSDKDWYVFHDNYGTSEEKCFVKFIDKTYDALKSKYDQIFLVRNEKHFQLFNFDDGKPIEPDFVLFLRKKESEIALHYQVFIEPKGAHLLQYDAWKETFLKSLKKRHKINVLWETKKYTIWGMPFYNEALRKKEFEDDFSLLVK